jgi:hypothetical protein
MTVCIAAMAGKDNAIVAIADERLSNEDFSTDTAFKFEELNDRWAMMWASGELSHIVPIRERAAELCSMPPFTRQSVESAVITAYQERRREEAEQRHLLVFGLTMDTFLSNTSSYSGSFVEELTGRIQAVELKCQFLVFGFDERNKPHIFWVTDPGVARHEDAIGFAAIGSGWYRAISAMFSYAYTADSATTEEALYRVCEAKFLSESAAGVGERAIALIKRPTDGYWPILPRYIQEIRKYWESNGKPSIPNDAPLTMKNVMDKIRAERAKEMFGS